MIKYISYTCITFKISYNVWKVWFKNVFWFVEYEFHKISSPAKIELYNKYSIKKEINFKLKNRHSGEMLAAEKHKRT